MTTDADRIKRSNPKDAVGTGKVPFSTVPAAVMAEIGLAMLEGARKYRRHNYRAIGVRASVYYDAAIRHLMGWWEGEDTDPDSGLSHITKALSTLTVLRDAMLNNKLNDDRPPAMADQEWLKKLNEKARDIVAKYPKELEPYVQHEVETEPNKESDADMFRRLNAGLRLENAALQGHVSVLEKKLAPKTETGRLMSSGRHDPGRVLDEFRN